MKTVFYGKEGQIVCHNCGKEFELDSYGGSKSLITRCPNINCNTGSWVTQEPYGNFVFPVLLDVTKMRRRIEDRLRKDSQFLKTVSSIY